MTDEQQEHYLITRHVLAVNAKLPITKAHFDEISADSDASRTGFRRKPDSVPMIADSR